MLDVHADEIFNHGVFNGDPHPGNILLMPDGRLGLIDYGQGWAVQVDPIKLTLKSPGTKRSKL
jgi:predicted unusual protein kinase regulating ubiquinone biosynthesis (AarF/ABC1/UbiB family)